MCSDYTQIVVIDLGYFTLELMPILLAIVSLGVK